MSFYLNFPFRTASIAWWNATKSKAIKFQVFITIIAWAYNRFWKVYIHIVKQACEPLVCWNEYLHLMVRFFQDKDTTIDFFDIFDGFLWIIKIHLSIFQLSSWPTCCLNYLKISLRGVIENWWNGNCLFYGSCWILIGLLNINHEPTFTSEK